jgi:ferric-dicitrate binding protein FerR (iron transport regulator)
MDRFRRQNRRAGGGIVSDRIEAVPPSPDDDETTVQLLRAADPRTSVSVLRAARVRSAARGAWEVQIRRRTVRRRVVILSSILGAGTLSLVFGREALLERKVPAGPGDPAAIVEQVDGPSHVQRNHVVRVGDWIEMAPDSRLALRFGDRTSVRLDTGSRLRVLSPMVVELAAGAVYVDTGSERGGFEVRTAMGTAHDIGTQFEVRLLPQSVRVRVRTGMVQLRDSARSIAGHQGTEITLSATGAVTRPFNGHDAGWDWATRVAPPLEMEGVSLATFLERAARERGWKVEYADLTLAREAKTIVLHGSVAGLTPDDAIEVAVGASSLRHRIERGSVIVLRADASQKAERDTSP